MTHKVGQRKETSYIKVQTQIILHSSPCKNTIFFVIYLAMFYTCDMAQIHFTNGTIIKTISKADNVKPPSAFVP